MTPAALTTLRANPPHNFAPIVRPLCTALLDAHAGHPWDDRYTARLLGAASTWAWCDSGVIAQLVEELKRVHARQPGRLL